MREEQGEPGAAAVEQDAGVSQITPPAEVHQAEVDILGIGFAPREPGSSGLGYRGHPEGTLIAAAPPKCRGRGR